MIVEVTCPDNITKVNYGGIAFQPGDDPLDVPAYVAKGLVALAGFACGANLTPSYATLLGNTDPDDFFEANYLFLAYGLPLPDADTRLADAQALLTANGPPACSAA